MVIVANAIIFVVAVLHLLFMALEMFLWTKPLGLRTFGMTQEAANASATLAANQGLYNGFLAAGLIWGLWTNTFAVKAFFLVCVVIAGTFGGVTAKRSILYLQALPGVLGLLFLILAR